MRRLAMITVLAAAVAPVAAAAAPAGMRTDNIAVLIRSAQLTCQNDLRGSACADRQQRLLSSVAADARSGGDRSMAIRQAASRQLDVLIDSIR